MWPFAFGSLSALMTLPSAERLWLIAMASLSESPVTPDLVTRSEPARSTRCSFADISAAARLAVPCE